MTRLLTVPTFVDRFDRVAAVVWLLQRHSRHPPILTPFQDLQALSEAKADRRFDVALLTGGGIGQKHDASRLVEEVRFLGTQAPDLRVVVVLIDGGGEPSGLWADAATVDLIQWSEEDTPSGVAARLRRSFMSSFVSDFLEIIPPGILSGSAELALGRLIEGLEEGVALSEDALSGHCGLETSSLKGMFAASGGLASWQARTVLYAVARRAEEGIAPASVVAELRCGTPHEFDGMTHPFFGNPGIGLLGAQGWRELLGRIVAAGNCRRDSKCGAAAGSCDNDDGGAANVDRDPEGFVALMGQHESRALRAASVIADSDQDAADVVQELFIRIWGMDPTARHRINAAYIVAAARNGARDLFRQRRRQATWGHVEFSSVPSLSSGLEQRDCLSASALLRHVSRALEGMPTRQAVVLWLHLLRGWEVSEVAAILGCSSSAVRGMIRRGRKHLVGSAAAEALGA